MAVTLYRCQKCRGLFNAVFEPNKWCRDCKLNQTSGGTSKSSLANTFTVLTGAEELTIIEPEEAMSGSKSSAIGGPIGDAQNVFAQQQAQQYQQGLQSAAGLQGLMGASGQTANPPQGYEFQFSGWREGKGYVEVPLPEPKPESSPHESILKPSRKLKFAAE